MRQVRGAKAVLLLAVLTAALSGCEKPWARSKTFVLGPRVPRQYFFTSAAVQSDDGPQASCRDQARVQAGLGAVNVVSSVAVLPREAREIEPPARLPTGCILDAAVAEISGPKGQRLTAAVMVAQVRLRKTGESVGGLAVRYQGHAPNVDALAELDRALERSFARRYDSKRFELANPKTVIESFTPERKLGTALVAVVFSDLIHPQIGGPTEFKSLRDVINE